MSALVTIYNDGDRDIQIVRLNGRSGEAFERKIMPSSDDAPQQFHVNQDELLIVTTAEATSPESAD